MPPAGAPRPDQAASNALATYLETTIDRDAMNAPSPGKLALVHRLTRTEYQNAIRDLLAIDALPKEIDYPLLLPADNSSSGFDNIADLLFVSPVIMERYLDAAEKISRLAIGDTKAPVRQSLSPESRAVAGRACRDLPWGTRGGHRSKPLPGRRRVPDQSAALGAVPRAASARGDRRRRARADHHRRRARPRTQRRFGAHHPAHGRS
jgi:hypothetical protein